MRYGILGRLPKIGWYYLVYTVLHSRLYRDVKVCYKKVTRSFKVRTLIGTSKKSEIRISDEKISISYFNRRFCARLISLKNLNIFLELNKTKNYITNLAKLYITRQFNAIILK